MSATTNITRSSSRLITRALIRHAQTTRYGGGGGSSGSLANTNTTTTTTNGCSSASTLSSSSSFLKSRCLSSTNNNVMSPSTGGNNNNNHLDNNSSVEYLKNTNFFDMIKTQTTMGTSTTSTTTTSVDVGNNNNNNIKLTKSGINENNIRFKTIHHMDESDVYTEHKVTMMVYISDLPLNRIELAILKEIVGTRLNLNKGELKLSSLQFGSRIENKRHLISQLDRLVYNCKLLYKEIQQENDNEEKEEEDES